MVIFDTLLLLVPLVILFSYKRLNNKSYNRIILHIYKLSFAFVVLEIAYSWSVNIGVAEPLLDVGDSLIIGSEMMNTVFSTFLVFFYVTVLTYIEITKE